MPRAGLVISAFALAAAQIGFLSWFIVARAAVLRDGREITLKVEPIDPRDLLRGDYVRLSYDISNIPTSLVANMPPEPERLPSSDIYVRMKQKPDGNWHPLSAVLDKPPEIPLGADEIEVHGTLGSDWNPGSAGSLRVNYGLERYYVPEGAGKPIEDRMRERVDAPEGKGTVNAHTYAVVVAVAPGGTAQIKRLLEDDKLLFEEPLY
jgi:uncharacterized membrane-anchored protein